MCRICTNQELTNPYRENQISQKSETIKMVKTCERNVRRNNYEESAPKKKKDVLESQQI